MINSLVDEADERRKRGDHSSAAALCRRAIAEAPEDPRPHSLLGLIALETFEYAEARGAFAKALALAPDNVELLNHYGASLAHAGDFDGARAQFQKAVAIDPNWAFSYCNLVRVLPASEGRHLVADLERLRSQPGLSNADRSIVGFALGKLYDELGEWDRAFECFEEANRFRAARYDHAATAAFLQASKAAYAPIMRAKTKAAGNPSDRPVFIVGMPRTGSSLIEGLLARHPDVTGLGEREEIERIVRAIGRHHPSRLGFPRCAPLLSGQELDGFGEQYLRSVAPQAGGARRIVDKQLLNFQHVPFLKMLFPNAAIIHTKRDAVDTCLSAYFQNFRKGYQFTFDLGDLGRVFAAYADLMAHWNELMPGPILEQRYETLIISTDESIAALFAAIGLAAPSEIQTTKSEEHNIRTSSLWQARQPIYATSVKRWKNYERHLGPLFRALDEAGYHYDGLG